MKLRLDWLKKPWSYVAVACGGLVVLVITEVAYRLTLFLASIAVSFDVSSLKHWMDK